MRSLALVFLLITKLAQAVPCDTQLASPVWTKANTRAALLALGQAGYDLNTKNLKTLKDPQAIEIITHTLGFYARPRILVEQTTSLYGSLQNALWTKETVKLALQALSRAGHRPHAAFFKYTKATPEILSVVQKAVGFSTPLGSVYSQAKRLFGKFKAALEYAGLGDLYHSKGSQWTKHATELGLRTLYKNGYRPKPYYLTQEADYEAQALLEKALGFPVSLGMLYLKAKEFHGGDFKAALLAAKLPADEILAIDPRLPWDKEAVYRGLRALYKAGYIPSASFLQKSNDPNAAAFLNRAVGFKTTLASFYNKAVEFHPHGFQQAVEKARLPVREIVGKLSAKALTAESIMLGLQALDEEGFDPTPELFKRRDPEVEGVLTRALGIPVTTSMFYKQALIYYDSNFQSALSAAGLSAEELMQRWNTDLLTPSAIVRGMRALFNNGYFPTVTLEDRQDPRIAEILKEALGFPVRVRTFFRYAREYNQGRIQNARKKAGILERRLVGLLNQGQPMMAKAEILHSLQALYDRGVYYNTGSIGRNSGKVKKALREIFSEPVGLSYLYNQARLAFGSYRKALMAADLPADEIIQYRNPNINYWAPTGRQTEVWSEDGELRKKTFLGETAPTPEDEILRQDVQNALLAALPEDLRKVGQLVLDEILKAGESCDYTECLQALQSEGESADQIRRVFSSWRSNKELWAYLAEFG